jgi:MFS family permease
VLRLSEAAAALADNKMGGRVTTYFGEFKLNWRPLLSASVGLSGGALLNTYLLGLFAPHLIEEFGWTRSQFALVAANVVVMIVTYPFVGRLVDTLGVRRVAALGVLFYPLSFVALALQNGNFYVYYAITTAQVVLGAFTTAFVYSRMVATVFSRARGFALAIVNGAPAIMGAVTAPIMANFIEDHGFRAGYYAIAILTASVSALGFLFMPRRGPSVENVHLTKRQSTGRDYATVARNRVFWLVMIGAILCGLATPLQSTQLQLVLQDNGAVLETAAFVTSVFAIGVMVGRFACGVLLDRFSTPIVSTLAMGLPGVGLAMLASNFDQPVVLGAAMLLVGLSQGAEGDIMAYIVAKYFPPELYGTVMGLIGAGLGFSIASGAIMLSITLGMVEHYAPFVAFGAAMTFVGAALFLFLGRAHVAQTAAGQPQQA